MPIIVRTDIILDNRLVSALGIKGRVHLQTTRAVTGGGFGQVNIDWTEEQREYTMGTVPALPADWKRMEGLYHVTSFGAYGFLMQDPKDQVVGPGDGLLQPLAKGEAVGVAGFGYGVPTCQLVNRYSALGTSRTYNRPIRHPRLPITLTRGPSVVTPGVNADTGVVTFTADASQAMGSIATGATTVLNFASGSGIVAAMGVGERVFLTGITGTAAGVLNDLPHIVSAKGAASLTLSTATTGLVATGGTAARYPQALEALGWTGMFYVPVQFMDDFIDWDLVRSGPADTRLMVGPSIQLQEVRE